MNKKLERIQKFEKLNKHCQSKIKLIRKTCQDLQKRVQ